MTNEEIEKAAEQFSGSREFLDYLIDSCDSRNDSSWEMRQALAASMRALVLQAYEEAIKAACPFCAEGCYELDREVMEHQVEQVRGGGAYVPVPCQASGIHSLKDSLVQESVSSAT